MRAIRRGAAITLALALVLAAAVFGIVWLRGRPAGPASAAASPAARRVLYYRHPMNAAIHSDHPARDDMGMNYLPVYEDEAQASLPVAGRSVVTVPADRLALLGVRSEPVGADLSTAGVRTVGRVAVDESRRQVVHAKYDGYIERLLVDFTGQPVGKGQPLLAIYSPELVAAQQEYLVARRARERLSGSSVPGVAQGGGELVEASRQRLSAWGLGPTEIASLETTGTPARLVIVRSPAAGVVTAKLAVEGMRVSPSDRLYEIADLSRVWVMAQVFEKDLAAVRAGMPARVTLPEQPGKEWRGTVAFVSPTVASETRTAEARVELANPGGVLKPEMFVDVQFQGTAASALSVPDTAVIFTGERTLVFVDRGQGVFEPREVRLGSRTARGYTVAGGLVAGERVVVTANFLLDSESSLRAAIAGAEGRP